MSYGFPTSEHLGAKLHRIRAILNLTQQEMIDYLGLRDPRAYISNWEHGKTEPSLNALLRYAYAAGISVDCLVDDGINFPPLKWLRDYQAHAPKINSKFPTSEHLGAKLYQIRAALNLSQNDMIDHLGLRGVFDRAYISFWENGKIEPPLHGLLKYARSAGVSLNILADDALKLSLPSQVCKHKTRA